MEHRPETALVSRNPLGNQGSAALAAYSSRSETTGATINYRNMVRALFLLGWAERALAHCNAESAGFMFNLYNQDGTPAQYNATAVHCAGVQGPTTQGNGSFPMIMMWSGQPDSFLNTLLQNYPNITRYLPPNIFTAQNFTQFMQYCKQGAHYLYRLQSIPQQVQVAPSVPRDIQAQANCSETVSPTSAPESSHVLHYMLIALFALMFVASCAACGFLMFRRYQRARAFNYDIRLDSADNDGDLDARGGLTAPEAGDDEFTDPPTRGSLLSKCVIS